MIFSLLSSDISLSLLLSNSSGESSNNSGDSSNNSGDSSDNDHHAPEHINDELELVDRARQGDETALNELRGRFPEYFDENSGNATVRESLDQIEEMLEEEFEAEMREEEKKADELEEESKEEGASSCS